MYIIVAKGNCGQTSSKIFAKEIIFRKALSPVNFAVNHHASICHDFFLLFSVYLGNKNTASELSSFQNTSQWTFLFLYMFFPLKLFKTNFPVYILLIKVFFEEKNIDCLEHLIAEHTL